MPTRDIFRKALSLSCFTACLPLYGRKGIARGTRRGGGGGNGAGGAARQRNCMRSTTLKPNYMMHSLSMPRLLGALLLAVSLFLVPACKGKNRDAEIQMAFNNKTQTDPNLAGVSATVVDGKVTLSGTCADEPCRQNAEKSVKDIDGVKEVVNNITVAPVTVSPDAQLQTSIQEVAARYPGVQASVASGVVTLRGTVARDQLQNLMQDINALRPQRIDNQLVIK